ncbi:unnamed protein product [Prorocentrum cordatum]|uniref:Uncharacterized protein n=1 Tax=Prorocentrum cordatum TaxID=2364126 RepID=A0ABN9WA20_9DINO|nr:unnamed protein product [Polarella glacialis]
MYARVAPKHFKRCVKTLSYHKHARARETIQKNGAQARDVQRACGVNWRPWRVHAEGCVARAQSREDRWMTRWGHEEEEEGGGGGGLDWNAHNTYLCTERILRGRQREVRPSRTQRSADLRFTATSDELLPRRIHGLASGS